jgi:hypothetical protein
VVFALIKRFWFEETPIKAQGNAPKMNITNPGSPSRHDYKRRSTFSMRKPLELAATQALL